MGEKDVTFRTLVYTHTHSDAERRRYTLFCSTFEGCESIFPAVFISRDVPEEILMIDTGKLASLEITLRLTGRKRKEKEGRKKCKMCQKVSINNAKPFKKTRCDPLCPQTHSICSTIK